MRHAPIWHWECASDFDGGVSSRDNEFMARALELARRGWGQTAPNPMVGAVVVAGQEIVGEGYHARFGDAHAEIVALRNAAGKAKGATLYVSLEPCAHHGKTPPCTEAIVSAGVARVVAAVGDPNKEAAGGAQYLRTRGVDVTLGVRRNEAAELNAAFFNAQCADRPWVTLKLAVSADGAIAPATRERHWITGEEARREVHWMRAANDAIAVGVETVIADDPALTVRDAPTPRQQPMPVVFDSTLRIPAGAHIVRTAREFGTIVVAREPSASKQRALEDAGVRILRARTLGDGLRALRRMEIRSILLEGGARLAASFLEADAVDRLVIFRSPEPLGPGALPAFADARAMSDRLARTTILDRRIFDKDTMTVYGLNPVPCLPV